MASFPDPGGGQPGLSPSQRTSVAARFRVVVESGIYATSSRPTHGNPGGRSPQYLGMTERQARIAYGTLDERREARGLRRMCL